MKFKFFFLTILVLSLSNCARRGTPTGGPKDESKPVLIKTIPAFKSLNFKEKEIKIYFDEYVKIKDLDKHLVISPPLKHPLSITPLGVPSKKIIIKFKDTLIENTTYSINFGESIIDNNEGNIISDFKYVFSTGTYLDSLTLKGTVKDAFFKKESEYVSILLYKADSSFTDSTIFKNKPLYVTNTLKSDSWQFENLKSGNYYIFALKEEYKDYNFNPKTEQIAFVKKVVTVPSKNEISLRLFKEIPKFKHLKPITLSKGHVIVPFIGNATNLKAVLKARFSGLDEIEYRAFLDNKKDSLHIYYRTNKPIDSLRIRLDNKEYQAYENLKLRASKIDSLQISSSIRGIINFNDTLKLTTNNPIEKLNKKFINILNKDSISVDFSLKKADALNYLFLLDKKEKENYKIQLLPNAIIDFFNQKNKDTIKYSFRTTTKEKYGSITLDITNAKKTYIVQLLNSNQKITRQKYARTSQKVTFELLPPANYTIRVVFDANENGKWDTGNYLLKRQPEKVQFFNKEIEVKENWFVNETLKLE